MSDELGKLFTICRALQEGSPARGSPAPGRWEPGLGPQLPGSLPKLCHLCGSVSPNSSCLPARKTASGIFSIRIFPVPSQPDPLRSPSILIGTFGGK